MSTHLTKPGPFLILGGPTAVGKTELSLTLAEKIDAEIISADSRQIYKTLDIGTAKASSEELERVPHHFIDELELEEPYSAGRFERDARKRIAEIARRERQPLVAGGSTLYIHALKYGLADIPDVPSSIRSDVDEELEERGADALYADLQKVDATSARTLDPTKTQRLIRALEVFRATGKPLSHYHEQQQASPYAFKTFVLHRDRVVLYERINRRVDEMLERGLLDEVRAILERGCDPSLNPLQTIGYREPIRYLRGGISYEEMVRLIKRNTRRYAKRQLTWFRRDESNVWLDAARPADALIDEILAQTM